MIFLNTHLQPLSIYNGGFMAFNYLYERHLITQYKDHAKHLLALFYINKREQECYLIHVSTDIQLHRVQNYQINIYQYIGSHSMLYLEQENQIKGVIEDSISIWTTTSNNQFLLFFELRKLSQTIGRSIALNKSVADPLQKYEKYKKSTIAKLENGLNHILDYICINTSLEAELFQEDFLIKQPMIQRAATQLEDWYAVWQLYRYQQGHVGWHEAVKWLRSEIEHYRKCKAIEKVITNIWQHKVTNLKD